MTRWKTKDKFFTVRQREERGRLFWQIGENINGDQAYYNGSCAKRWFDRYAKRGLVPQFENDATEPMPCY